tara:strand:- start:19294 stop:20214 length:921 start_codon:yes stop_codon:yes gene_type:complete
MKVSPLKIIENKRACLKFNCFFITGSDEGFIFDIKELVSKSFKEDGYSIKNEIKNRSPGLFETDDKSLFVINGVVDEDLIKNTNLGGDAVLMFEKTSTKNKAKRGPFIKNNDRAFVECYELDALGKKTVLNSFVHKNNLSIQNENYWFLLDALDSRFSILKNELEKISQLENINDMDSLKKILGSVNFIDASKLFFKIKLSRAELTKYIYFSINSLSDFQQYFFSIKMYVMLLICSNTKQELEKSIPRYLFRERGQLLNIYDSLDKTKKKLLANLIYKTETLSRKNPSLFRSLCFRFTLQFRKIIF